MNPHNPLNRLDAGIYSKLFPKPLQGKFDCRLRIIQWGQNHEIEARGKGKTAKQAVDAATKEMYEKVFG